MRSLFVAPSRGWPGSHLLFFASPKQSKQKKGDAEGGAKTVPCGCRHCVSAQIALSKAVTGKSDIATITIDS